MLRSLEVTKPVKTFLSDGSLQCSQQYATESSAILSQLKRVQNLTSYFCNIHVNIMPSDFKQNFLRTRDLPHVFFVYYSAHKP